MRRWFVTFLTLMLLAQFTWAATSKCCLSELKGPDRPGEVVMAQTLHADDAASDHHDAGHACQVGHCHCHHASVATGFAEPSPPAATAWIGRTLQRADASESHIPDGLDRPNWQLA
jgi:hypothetical protein